MPSKVTIALCKRLSAIAINDHQGFRFLPRKRGAELIEAHVAQETKARDERIATLETEITSLHNQLDELTESPDHD
jgi:hypothetical protein